jgi:hypothetical protein
MKYFLIILYIFNSITVFSNDFEEKNNIFASEGFGFKINQNERFSRSLFMENHGEPLVLSEVVGELHVDNMWIDNALKTVTLEYQNFIIIYFESFHFSKESILFYIESKNESEYLYTIKHNMEINELIEILGDKYNINNMGISYMSSNGDEVHFYIKNNRIDLIRWYISLE